MIVYAYDIIITGDDLIERDILRKKTCCIIKNQRIGKAEIFSWHKRCTFRKGNVEDSSKIKIH